MLPRFKISHIVTESWLLICGTQLGDETKKEAEKGVKQVYSAKSVLTAELYILFYGKATD
jgi:hypothetical protein